MINFLYLNKFNYEGYFMNKDSINNYSTKEDVMNEKDLLEFLKYTFGCTYISDLRIEPYNNKSKILLEKLDLGCYSLNQIRDAIEYIYSTHIKQ